MSISCPSCGHDVPKHVDRGTNCGEANGDACLACSNLMEGRKRVSEAQSALKNALEEYRRLKTAVNNDHDPISRKLPIELASRIFAGCLPQNPAPDDFDVHNFHPPNLEEIPSTLFKLAAVCQGWRQILFSNPGFWKVLPLVAKYSTPMSRIQLVKEWLGRSSRIPFTLSINVNTGQGIPDASYICSLANLLSRHMYRCAILYSNSPWTLLRHLRCGKEPQQPSLSSLILEASSSRDYTSPILKHDGVFDLGELPSPDYVSITAYHLVNVKIRWDHVTRFVGRYLRINECIALFRQAPQLAECTFECLIVANTSSMAPQSPVTHFSLKTLVLDNCELNIQDYMFFPALEDLTCLAMGDEVVEELTSLIRRSKCRLKELMVYGSFDSDEDIIDLLRATPSLESLHWGNGAKADFFRLLEETTYWEVDDTNNRFLPNLKSFFFTSSLDVPWSIIHTIAPINPPRPNMGHRPLSKIIFDLEGDDHDEDILQNKIKLEDAEAIVNALQKNIDIRVQYESVGILEKWLSFHELLDDLYNDSDELSQADIEME